MSGTSMDGVDAALVEFPDGPPEPLRLVAHRSDRYESELRSALRSCAAGGTTADVARLNVAVGEVFADAARRLLSEAGIAPAEVDCIGSHGQTLVHLPEAAAVAGTRVRATLQVGEPAVIAARTGITTVADFRPRDLAEGGQGAPLVPLLDLILLGGRRRGRVALNLGGIANVTSLPPNAGVDDLVAFDTGPGNVLLDRAARYGGLAEYDPEGETARSGRVRAEVLERLCRHPYLEREPPKSADTGTFLHDLWPICRAAIDDVGLADVLRTLSRFTAVTVAAAVERHVTPSHRVDDVVVSGGGTHNRSLMSELERGLAPIPLLDLERACGVPGDAKEAVAFALLGAQALLGRPGNVPGATGARRKAILGKITPA